MITDEEVLDYLEHFGVKGMRWGVRKSSEQKQSNRNAKAQKYLNKAADIQKQIDTVKNTKNIGFYSRSLKIQKLTEEKRTAEKDAELKRQGKLSTKQKQVAIGVGVAAGILAAYGTYQSLNSGNARRLMVKGKAFMTKDKSLPWKKNEVLANPNFGVGAIRSNVVARINPNYGAPGTKMNCRRATMAYEMRRRGYDVVPTLTTNARGQDITGAFNILNPGANLVPPGRLGMATRIMGETFKRDKPFSKLVKENPMGGKEVFPTEIIKEISSHPNGARGELGMVWNSGGGHSMAWEIVKGKPVIFDTQNGKVFETPQEIQKLSNMIMRSTVTRLDNVELNTDFLTRWLK